MHHYAKSVEELAPRDEILSKSGLAFMRDIVEGRIAGPPIGQTLGFRPIEVDEGLAIFEGTPEFCTMNPIGTVHGGWYGTILDSCMACAVQTSLKAGQIYTTLEYKINILRPIPVGMTVHAIGKVQHVGRSTGVSNGEVRGVDDGKLYATGSTTCIIMANPKR
ncbi:PaaI family thioesterase [Shimia sp. NS0008-38b]|uniref:PaaI family thioesterase n=1 Tax=Shimia sp. NS0008-38b TaxID=3127653 RepID=UPI003105A772